VFVTTGVGTTKDIVALIEETRRLELLQQEEEDNDEEDGETTEDTEEEVREEEVPTDTQEANESAKNDNLQEIAAQLQPTPSISESSTPAPLPTVVIANDDEESKAITPKSEENTKSDETKPASTENQTIPMSSGKDDLPVDSTFMTEVMSMFDGIASSTSPNSDSGLGVEDGKKSSNGAEYSDSDSDIEEGVIKRIHRTTILTSDLTISRV
jgi:hypothetical protein